MHEACLNLLGVGIADKKGSALALKTLQYIRELISEIQEETGALHNLEATPAEGTSYRLAMLDKERYPDGVCANETAYREGAAPFYTNSTHLPVYYTDDMFEALTLQDELQAQYTGGTVHHIYLGEGITDIETIKGLIKKVATRFRVPYFTLTPTFSVCPYHGYLPGKQPKCSRCSAETEVYSRVVGYLSPVKHWNDGKQAEFNVRSTYTVAVTTMDAADKKDQVYKQRHLPGLDSTLEQLRQS
jgi:ribonucleoside-triphosphate reductase